MSIPPGDADRLHLSARFGLVPFAARLMQGQVKPGSTPQLPFGDPDALTRESIEALTKILNQGVTAWLMRSCGWQELESVGVDPDEPERRRLWNSAAIGGFSLSFSSLSIDWLIACYNLTRKKTAMQRSEEFATTRSASLFHLSIPGTVSGDLLLQRRLAEIERLPDPVLDVLAATPVNMLSEFDRLERIDAPFVEGLQQLLEPGLLPILPWLARRWLRSWRARDLEFPSCKAFERYHTNQHSVWSHWFALVLGLGREDLLCPWLDYWHSWLGQRSPGKRFDRFERLTNGLKLQQRQQIGRIWAASLESAMQLNTISDRLKRLHPIDREARHKVFLAAWSRTGFDTVASAISKLQQRVAPTLG